METKRLLLEESNITDDLIVMETKRLLLEESNITDDLIVMETTRLLLEESNITDNQIVFLQQNSSKISREKSWMTQVSKGLPRELNVSVSTMKLALNEYLRCYSYKRCRGQLLA